MSPIDDRRRMKTASPPREAVEYSADAPLARTLQVASVRMRPPVTLPAAIGAAILGTALLANGVAPGAALLLGLPLLMLLPRRKPQGPLDRSAVRLALRLARVGQRTLLVESGDHLRVVRIHDAAAGPKLQYVAALADGALLLARARTGPFTRPR
jgi:hypothetical protein